MMDYKGWAWVLGGAGFGAVVAATIVAARCCTGADSESWVVASWVWILLQFGVSGAVGGCLAVLRLFDLETMYKSADWAWTRTRALNLAVALAISATGGVGGAMVALYLLILNEKMKDASLTNIDILRNCTMALIAGFVGFSLLRKAGDSFDKLWMQSIENKTEALNKKLAEEALNNATNLGLQVWKEWQTYKSTQHPADPKKWFQALHRWRMDKIEAPDFKEAYQRLELARVPFSENRMASIVFANLNLLSEKYTRAIAIVTETITAIESQITPANRTISEENIGDLLNNRACYEARLAVEGPEAERPVHKRKMLDDLRRCFALTPNNRAEAVGDDYLIEFREDPDFIALVTPPTQ